ncbi:hypothetical protein BCLUESOX_111 [bacterium endosymbiont of Bathymodiolus sp. 5 South]|jgi:hypothetical protein|nr:hypothetical protein BCLUESOX_111 [bacterium endosymbiont of Bathymodiolus sp. 5 South]VVH63858.1 hypothetical protein BSPWISOX_3018 [uncultured Gammaproteobacteria bacterium]
MSCQPLYAITPKNPSLAAQISEATPSLGLIEAGKSSHHNFANKIKFSDIGN